MENKVFNFTLNLGWNLLKNVSKLDRFDASWTTIEKKEKQSLKQLKNIATVRSVGASTRIEGSKMSNDEVKVLLDKIDITKIEDRDAQEVIGYFEVLDLISENHTEIDITENNLKNLHNILLKYSDKDQWHKGNYKQHSNAVEANLSDGTKQIIFQTTNVRKLIEWYKNDTETHPLVKSAVFSYEFVSIHPFQDGNGTNDIGNLYNVTGINKSKASKIVYRAESVYFTATTNYHQARNLTIQAAKDLYGNNSSEVFSVTNAWYAVGIGSQPQQVSHTISGPTQLTPGLRAFYSINPYTNATNYVWTIPNGCHYNYCWGITQGQGSPSIGIKAGKTGHQTITCIAYNGNSIIGSQYISVNVQNPYNGGNNGNGGDPCGEVGGMINGVIYPPIPCGVDGLTINNSLIKEIIVFDTLGKKLIEKHNIENLDINYLSSGIYIIRMQLNSNELITKKIIKK